MVRKTDHIPIKRQGRLEACHRRIQSQSGASAWQWLLRVPLRLLGLVWFGCQIYGQLPDIPSVVIANHTGIWDPLPLERVSRWSYRKPVVMGKATLFQNRLLAWFLPRMGFFPVQRGQGDGQAINTAQYLLQHGSMLLVFPEGTWILGREIGEFHQGAARLALSSGVPIIPIYLDGTQHKGRAWIPKGLRFHIHVGQPIQPGPGQTPEELTRQARQAMLDLQAAA